jgi:hypothetical protein
LKAPRDAMLGATENVHRAVDQDEETAIAEALKAF